MIVICKKSTKKLVKGVKYNAIGLWNSGINNSTHEGNAFIENFGMYSINNFTDIDGKPLPKIVINIKPPNNESLDFKDVKKGDILVCKNDQYKTLIKGGKYIIDELNENPSIYINWNGVKCSRIVKTIKFEGIKRHFSFNGWAFRKLTKSETREMSLGSVLNNEELDIIKTGKVNKFDFIDNKELELIKILSKSILDPNRHQLSIIDWACQMSSNNIGITPNNYNMFMNMTLKEILELIETNV